MKCKSIKKKLLEYLDGILDPCDIITVEDHIRQCKSCRNDLEMLVRLSDAIHKVDYPPTAIWDNFLDDLHGRIEREMAKNFVESQKNKVYITWGWTSAAIAAVIFLIASIFIEYHMDNAKNYYMPSQKTASTKAFVEDNEGYIIAEIVSKAFIDDKRVSELKKLQKLNESGILSPVNYNYYPAITESAIQPETKTEEETQTVPFVSPFDMRYMDSLEYYASESSR